MKLKFRKAGRSETCEAPRETWFELVHRGLQTLCMPSPWEEGKMEGANCDLLVNKKVTQLGIPSLAHPEVRKPRAAKRRPPPPANRTPWILLALARPRRRWAQQGSRVHAKLRQALGTGLNQQTGASEAGPARTGYRGGAGARGRGGWEGPDSSVPSPEAAVWGAHASGGPRGPAARKPATPAARRPRSSRGSCRRWRLWQQNTLHTPGHEAEPGRNSSPGRYGKPLGQKCASRSRTCANRPRRCASSWRIWACAGLSAGFAGFGRRRAWKDFTVGAVGLRRVGGNRVGFSEEKIS